MKKRAKLTLPQPMVFEKLHGLRLKMHGKAERLGWERYLVEMNERAGHLLGKSPVPSPARLAHRSPPRPLGILRGPQAPRPSVSA